MQEKTRSSQILSLLSIIAGLWLMFSPYILGYQMPALIAEQTVIGVLIIGVAQFRVALPHVHWPSWVNVLLSLELLIVALTTAAATAQPNMVITGCALLAASVWAALSHSPSHRPLQHRR